MSPVAWIWTVFKNAVFESLVFSTRLAGRVKQVQGSAV